MNVAMQDPTPAPYAADSPAGWALIAEPTAKERRFCKKLGIEIIEAGVEALIEAAGGHPKTQLLGGELARKQGNATSSSS